MPLLLNAFVNGLTYLHKNANRRPIAHLSLENLRPWPWPRTCCPRTHSCFSMSTTLLKQRQFFKSVTSHNLDFIIHTCFLTLCGTVVVMNACSSNAFVPSYFLYSLVDISGLSSKINQQRGPAAIGVWWSRAEMSWSALSVVIGTPKCTSLAGMTSFDAFLVNLFGV